MADLQLVMQDGSHQVVTLEGGRIQKGEPPRGWEQIGFSDDAWRPAAALPPPPARPWMCSPSARKTTWRCCPGS